MTTRLFAAIDLMVTIAQASAPPELAGTGRIESERTLTVVAGELPCVSIQPRRSQPGGLGGEVLGRDNTVVVVVRAMGDKPGRKAHELLAALHAAWMAAPAFSEPGTLELATESFRYVDSEQSVCDLQAEYEFSFELPRESLLGF